MTTNITTGQAPSFFEQYFIRPIIERTGYNTVSTLTYGVILVIGSYMLFKFFKKLGYKIDMRFLKANTPFILLVSVWRVLTDAGVYPYSFLTTTPGLYLPVLLIFFPLIILAKKLEDQHKIKYEWTYTGISTALLITQIIIFATLMPGRFNFEAASKVIFYLTLSSLPILILSKYYKPLKDKFNVLMIISHFLDASATHVSIAYYNYFEQHVIPKFFFNIFGSSSFYALKLLVLGIIIYILDTPPKGSSKLSKDENDKELTNFIKIIFIIYGLAIGLRNFLRLSLGV